MRGPLAIARRLTAMSPDEIRTRIGIAIRQRLDVWETSLGRNPLAARRGTPPASTPRFFFDPTEVALLAAEARRRLPGQCDGVIESARRIQAGSFDLLGYRGLSFGEPEIDWQRDPVHGIRPPFEAWFRIPYLDFSKSGDHKIVWELSRHQHLMLLARAWLYSGDTRFLATLRNLWTHWRKANPYPMGINWSSTLEVAFRCMSWIWIDHLIADSGLRDAIGECAIYTERYISTYFAPNTHLLGEALSLFLVGVLYPDFERAQFWREYGWKVLLQESTRQVRPDGFHFEQSLYYHVYALEMFLHARILAARNGIGIPDSYDRTLIRMAEGLATLGAGGQPPRFGDDDGGRLFDGRRNQVHHMLDPLVTAAIQYRRGDWKALAADIGEDGREEDLREETIWLLGLDGLRTFDQLAPTPRAPVSRAFHDSGYYAIAGTHAVAVIDAGPHGWGNAGHGHADALSIQLIAGGRALLTDPGTGSYPHEKPDRDRFRATAAHNTLEVDGLSQAEPVHSFAWRSQPVTTVHHWHAGPRVTLFHGSHDGYQRLPQPVTHERWVIGWRDNVWIVLDRATGEGAHRLNLRWRLAPGGNHTLQIHTPSGAAWQATKQTGVWSPAYGAIVEAPVVHFSYEGSLPVNCATLLALNPPVPAILDAAGGNGFDVYRCTVTGKRRLVALDRSGAEMIVIDDLDDHPVALQAGADGVREIKSLPPAWERLWDPGPSSDRSAREEI